MLMADDKTTKTPEQPVTDSGPGKETPPAPQKEPEKVSVSPEPEKKTEPEVKNPQVSVYNFAEIMKEKKVEERAAAPSGEKPVPAKTEKPEKPLIGQLTPWMLQNLTPAGTFILFAIMCVPYMLIVWKLVPETTGKSLEEIERYWMKNKN